jgi:hypothetical protein
MRVEKRENADPRAYDWPVGTAVMFAGRLQHVTGHHRETVEITDDERGVKTFIPLAFALFLGMERIR